MTIFRDIKKVNILLSGGLDSMACIHFFKAANYEINCIHINYGQLAWKREDKSAKAIARYFSCPFKLVECTNLPVIDGGEIIGRNALIITIALFIIQNNPSLIATGIHTGTPYIDCSPIFIEKAQAIIDLYTDGKVKLINPFINWTKKDIWDYCIMNRLPMNLTYSCERGTNPPCGKCLSCKDLEALKVNDNSNT